MDEFLYPVEGVGTNWKTVGGLSKDGNKVVRRQVNPFLWKDSYEKNMDEFRDNILEIVYALRKRPIKLNELNPVSNYDIRNGVVDPDRYKTLEKPLGIQNLSQVKSIDVLTTIANVITNDVKKSPAEWAIHRTDEKFMIEKLDKFEDAAASLLKKQVVQNLNTEQQNFNYLIEPKDDKINSVDDVAKVLHEKDELEVELETIIQSCMDMTYSKRELDDCMDDRIIINCEIAQVVCSNGIVEVEKRDPRETFELYGNGKNFDDSEAVGHTEWVTMSHEVINNTAIYEAQNGHNQYINDILLGLSKDPDYAKGKIWYFNDISDYQNFYNRSFREGYIAKTHAEIKIYRIEKFKILRNYKPITPADYKEYKKFGSSVSFADEIQYEIADKMFKGFSLKIPVIDIWEVEIYGIDTIVRLQKVKTDIRYIHKRKTPCFSYVKEQRDEPSLITICRPTEWLMSAINYKIQDAILKDKGIVLSQVVNNIPNGQNGVADNLNTIANTGVSIIQENMSGQGDQVSSRHNVATNLDMSASVLNWQAALQNGYRMLSMVTGIPLETLGQIPSGSGLGQSKIALQAQYATTAHYYFEHNYFVEKVMNTMLEVGLRYWVDKNNLKFLSSRGRKTYLSSKPFEEGTFELYVKNLVEDKEKKKIINQFAGQFMDRNTDITALKGLMRIITSNSTSESLMVLEDMVDGINKSNQEQMQAQQQAEQQAAQMKSEIEKVSKIDIPRERIAADLEIAKMKMNVDEADSLREDEFKKDSFDFQQQDMMEDKMES